MALGPLITPTLIHITRPRPPDCGDVTPIVWFVPGSQLNTFGVVYVTPSTNTWRPEGTLVTVYPNNFPKFRRQ